MQDEFLLDRTKVHILLFQSFLKYHTPSRLSNWNVPRQFSDSDPWIVMAGLAAIIEHYADSMDEFFLFSLFPDAAGRSDSIEASLSRLQFFFSMFHGRNPNTNLGAPVRPLALPILRCGASMSPEAIVAVTIPIRLW